MSPNPIEAARLSLIQRLLRLPAPSYPASPSPADHQSVAEHIREAALLFDEWLAAIGSEVRGNARGYISKDLFAGSFTAAIDGNETYALDCEATSLIDERRAMRRAS